MPGSVGSIRVFANVNLTQRVLLCHEALVLQIMSCFHPNQQRAEHADQVGFAPCLMFEPVTLQMFSPDRNNVYVCTHAVLLQHTFACASCCCNQRDE